MKPDHSVQFIRYGALARIVAALAMLGILLYALLPVFRSEIGLPFWSLVLFAGLFVMALAIYLKSEYPMSATQLEAFHDMERAPRMRNLRWASTAWLVAAGGLLLYAMLSGSSLPYWGIVIGSVVWLAFVVSAYARIPRVWNGLTVLPSHGMNRLKRGMIAGAVAAMIVLLLLFAFYLLVVRRWM